MSLQYNICTVSWEVPFNACAVMNTKALNGIGNRCSLMMRTRGMNNSVHPVDVATAAAKTISVMVMQAI